MLKPLHGIRHYAFMQCKLQEVLLYEGSIVLEMNAAGFHLNEGIRLERVRKLLVTDCSGR